MMPLVIAPCMTKSQGGKGGGVFVVCTASSTIVKLLGALCKLLFCMLWYRSQGCRCCSYQLLLERATRDFLGCEYVYSLSMRYPIPPKIVFSAPPIVLQRESAEYPDQLACNK